MIKPIGSDRIAKLVGLGLVSSIVLLWASAALAQRRPIADETLGAERTIVTPLDSDLPVDLIDGGARRGNNLFHSFRDFQVDAGRGVYFTDPGVDNILGRVTGNVPSEILGTLGVLGGDANLFLINPNGIIFGENARLDVGGSFVATTANAIGFGNQGWFGVADPNAPPLLTVQPSAFLFNQVNPGAIENQSRASLENNGLGGLRVPDGQDLVFLGGTVINQGDLIAFGGRVELGSVAGLGTVRLSADGSLSFPSEIVRADVRMTDGSRIDVASDNGGNIVINARNIDISGESLLLAGIFPGLGTVDSQAGDVVLNGTGEIRVRQSSLITNSVGANGIGSSGNVYITAGSLFVTEGASLQALTRGQGNAGDVIIEAGDRVVFDDGDVFSTVGAVNFNDEVVGTGGDINIDANTLVVRNGAQLTASTFGQGDAGNVIIRAGDRVVFDDGDVFSTVGTVNFDGEVVGTGGDINIDANTLVVRNGAQLTASTFGQGDAGNVIIRAGDRVVFADGFAFSTVGTVNFDGEVVGTGGDINIDTDSLEVRNGAQLTASTFGRGNAGDVIIRAGDRVVFADGFAFSTVGTVNFDGEVVGTGGDINIDTDSLEVRNGAQLTASTFGRGNAGDVIIRAGDRVVFDDSAAITRVEEGGVGTGGDINIDANTLVVRNGTQLIANTSGRGNAGDVIIYADDRVVFDDGNVFSDVEEGGVGTGGDINIDANTLVVRNGAQLQASTLGQGNGGNVVIRAYDRVVFAGTSADGGFPSAAFSRVEENGVGTGGNIEIYTNSLEVRNGAQLQASTLGQGNGGNVVIRADNHVVFDDGDVFSTVGAVNFDGVAVGNGGNIEIYTDSLEVRNGAQLQAATLGQGKGGNVIIRADNHVVFDAAVVSSSVRAAPFNSEVILVRGNVEIYTDSLEVRNGAQLQASAFGQGDAGDVVIRADDRVVFDDGFAFSSVGRSGIGNGGNINIDTNALVVRNGAQLRTDSRGQGNAGNMNITARSVQLNRGRLIAETRTGNGGNITLDNVNLLQLRNGSVISTTAGTDGAGGNGGNIAIDSDFIVAVPNENSDITANAFSGSGGNVTITTQGLFGIEPQDRPTDRSDITASSELGVQGTIAINTPDVDPSRGLTELPNAPVDASNQIAQACPTNGNTAEALGEFVVTGRGGLPANPTELLSGDTVLPRLSGVPNEGTEEQVGRGANPEVDQLGSANPPPPPLVEAQGWQIDSEGNVALIAATPSQASAFAEVQCQSSN